MAREWLARAGSRARGRRSSASTPSAISFDAQGRLLSLEHLEGAF